MLIGSLFNSGGVNLDTTIGHQLGDQSYAPKLWYCEFMIKMLFLTY